ncbi:unnamed protein product [Moneuplotes crassus]|uniref:Uncharacterized protein n=1 Tax=Euplotes crassus TaxID=5936 RepID=A0AAD1X9M1_EUPCR|nr:unnamed protein product [Moneuplotes crassus]
MNIRDIEGARPTEFTSKDLRRDYMDICDIEGARPSVMKGYGGVMKEYEKPFSLKKISQLPYAGISKNDDHVENDLFQMSNEQNSAAEYLEFMRSKKVKTGSKPAGIVNMGFKLKANKPKYQYEPPYGYGDNFSTGTLNQRIDRNISTSHMQKQYYNFMEKISKPVNSHSRSENRNSYFSRYGNKVISGNNIADPNLNIKPVSNFIDPKIMKSRKYASQAKGNRVSPSSGANIFPSRHEQEYRNEEGLEEAKKQFFMIDEQKEKNPLPPLNPKKPSNQMGKNKKKRFPNTDIDLKVYNRYSKQGTPNHMDPRRREVINRSANLESAKNNRLGSSSSNILKNYNPAEGVRSSSNLRKYNYDSKCPYEPINYEKKRSAVNISRNKVEGFRSHEGTSNNAIFDQDINHYQPSNFAKRVPDIKASQRLDKCHPWNQPKEPYSYNIISASYDHNNL